MHCLCKSWIIFPSLTLGMCPSPPLAALQSVRRYNFFEEEKTKERALIAKIPTLSLGTVAASFTSSTFKYPPFHSRISKEVLFFLFFHWEIVALRWATFLQLKAHCFARNGQWTVPTIRCENIESIQNATFHFSFHGSLGLELPYSPSQLKDFKLS